ncbi:MAG: alpha/beta hydrolase [Candidatus Aminicenantes bacterium]|nr:alpha/beta hydrolase [Candidatus Aminicenantes bacterium]
MKNKVFFSGPKEPELCGILTRDEMKKSGPAVVLCHGFTTSKDSRTFLELEKRLIGVGVGVLRFDFYGHGESAGRFEEITVGTAVKNVKAAWNYLKEREFGPMGLVGSSFGGLAAALAAPDLDNLHALALKSPVTGSIVDLIVEREKINGERWKDDGFIHLPFEQGEGIRLNYTFYEDGKTKSAFDRAREIGCPVLIIHGDRDESVPIEQSRDYSKHLRQGQLHVIQGADHRYSEPCHFTEMIDRLAGFLLERLQVNSVPVSFR